MSTFDQTPSKERYQRDWLVGDANRVGSGVIGHMGAVVSAVGLTCLTARAQDGILKIPNSIPLTSGVAKRFPTTDAP
ncbi:MAG TPA: hypothetical protein VMU98_00860 [Acidimicrobiales bacterium]|nr:hypothetical protein [Acidimicrobiales bacterium]